MDMGISDIQWQEAMRRDAADDKGCIRPLDWRALCARLAAAQDLRDAIIESQGQSADSYPASFHRPAARLLAARQHRNSSVNHFYSIICNPRGEIQPVPAGKDRIPASLRRVASFRVHQK